MGVFTYYGVIVLGKLSPSPLTGTTRVRRCREKKSAVQVDDPELESTGGYKSTRWLLGRVDGGEDRCEPPEGLNFIVEWSASGPLEKVFRNSRNDCVIKVEIRDDYHHGNMWRPRFRSLVVLLVRYRPSLRCCCAKWNFIIYFPFKVQLITLFKDSKNR